MLRFDYWFSAPILIALSLCCAFPVGASADPGSVLKGLSVQVYPRCVNGVPVGYQPVEQVLALQFDVGAIRPRNPVEYEYLALEGRRLSLKDGDLMLSSALIPGEKLGWRTLGRIDSAAINCAWRKSEIPVQLAPGTTITLHEVRGEACQKQPGEVGILDSSFTKFASFRLDINSGAEFEPISLSGKGLSWFETLWQCIRGHGERVSILK